MTAQAAHLTHGAELPRARPGLAVGASAIAFAILFNLPFSILAQNFDYPDVLRRPAGEVLDLFAAGGPALILTWHAFALCALALVPFSFAFAITPARLTHRPALTIGAAIAGALAGLAQAIGLWRWVFVIPALARAHADPSAHDDVLLSAERSFDLLNAYGGVAIGEHMGQTLTALFVLLISCLQWGENKRVSGGVGFLSSALLVVGTGEGLAMALGQPGEAFGLVAIGGFLGLTLWLIVSGVGLVRGR